LIVNNNLLFLGQTIECMLTKLTLSEIIDAQRENLIKHEKGLKRNVTRSLPDLTSHALIISGIRRCGKSTLLYQLFTDKYPGALYFNFEDPRLYDFERNDFARLDEIIGASKNQVLLFDEIQIIKDWERYVRQKLDEGYKLIITGSNASLLSRELGTKLTGRHISKELFPFSYEEFCLFTKAKKSENSLLEYMKTGGFPEFVRHKEDDILQQLFDDILVRDIAVRYGVRDVKTLQRMALYLVSNTGKLITGNRLKTLFEIGATSTIMEYLSHLEYAWLFQFIPKFSHSIRRQLVNPRKVYSIDTGLISVNSNSFTDDNGRKLENLVFLHLRRKYKEIYYFSEKGECDFIVYNKGKFHEAVQVCYNLNADNIDRELNGLIEAMKFFKTKKGTIITLNQEDRLEKNGFIAAVIPCHHYLHKI
jgi:predicted AAA+ superfamily ATPase